MKKSDLVALSIAVFSSACALATAPALAADSRQETVAQRGPAVMPFDLSATTHIFTKTSTGGIQKVVAKRANDTEQIGLIRQHLREITQQFAQGNFSGPAHIHGDDMPGLAKLKTAGPTAMQLQYRDVEGGASITYTSKDPELQTALHQWFDAQLSDHGHDAVAGHDHSMMHR
jgi:hypothetical protein